MRLKAESLIPATQYAVQVRAVRDGKYSQFSERFLFTTTSDTLLPAAPGGFTWAVLDDSFVATWNPVTQDVSGNAVIISAYEVELVAGAFTKYVTVTPKTGTDLTYTLTFAANVGIFNTPQPAITARVRAVNNRGLKGAFSSAILATNPAPAAVTGFAATGMQDAISLVWTANTENDIDRYEIYTGTTSGFTPSSGNKIFSGKVTSFVYQTTTYSLQYFKIRAVDKFNQPSVSDALSSATPTSPFLADVTAPATPTALAATITNNGNGIGAKAAVTWTMSSPPSDLAGFNIRFRAVSTTNYQYMTGIDSADRAAQVILDLAYTNYEFQIQAYDFSDNKSAWSSTVTSTSPSNATPATVSGLSSVAGNNNIIYSWTPVADTDIKNYEVTFSTSPTFASGNITYLTGTASTLTVGGLAYGTTYYARVRANDTGGLSGSFSSTDTKATGAAPATSDGSAPSSSPAATVLGGLSYLYITWTPISNNDPVTYEVHLSTTTGFTPSGGTKVTEVMGSSAVVDILPGTTTPLSYGTTYFVKLIAKDKDGAAAAGTQGSGSISKVASTDVTSIGADLIVPGTGFVNALVVASGGSIQSSNWSSLTAGWKISTTGIEMNDTGSKIKVEALQAGTIGGGSGAGAIQIAAGTSLVLNGGYLKSNTYTGTSQATNPSGAGFYLGNDGLRVDQGIINSAALATGTVTATTITLGSGGSIVGGSWTLSSSGLSIPNGGVSAAALNIQTGNNLMPPQYSDFQSNISYYDGTTLTLTNGLGLGSTTFSRFNTQSLVWAPSGSPATITLAKTATDYNIILQASTSYIVSYYALIPTGDTAQTITPQIVYATATTPGTLSGSAVALAANSTWARYSSVVTVPGTATGQANLKFSSTGTTGHVYLDGIQIEQQISNSTTPSVYAPPGSTTIVGDMIRTGSLISELTTVVNGNTIPYWNINANGAASFANLQVRGNAVVGVPSGTDGGASQLASGNYVAGTSGWVIRSDGYAEFRNVVIAGDITNLVGDPDMANTGFWTLGTGFAYSGVAGPAPGDANLAVLRATPPGGTAISTQSPFIPVSSIEQYRLEWYGRKASGTVTGGQYGFNVNFYDNTQTFTTSTTVFITATTLTGAWTLYGGDITPPTGTGYVKIFPWVTSTVNAGPLLDFDMVTFRRKVGGTLLVNGAITSGTTNQVVISTAANPFQSGSNWGVIQFYADANSNYYPAQIWSNYTSSRSTLAITSPYTTTAGTTSSARVNLSTDASSNTQAELIAAKVTLSSNTMEFNSTNSSNYDVNMVNTNVLQIQQSTGSNRFTVALGNIGNIELKAMNKSAVTQRMLLTGDDILVNPTAGGLLISGDSNVQARIEGNAGGASLNFTSSRLIIGNAGFNVASGSVTSANLMDLWCDTIVSYGGGIFMNDLTGGGTTTASINTSGRIIRTSTKTMKKEIKPMTDKEAHSVLGLESYTFKYRKDPEYPDVPEDPRRYPGFVAEQGAEAGAELWVGRQHKILTNDDGSFKSIERDKNGKIIYFRTPDITVAHNVLIKELYAEIENLKAQVADLRS